VEDVQYHHGWQEVGTSISACCAAGWGTYLSLYLQMAKIEPGESVWKVVGRSEGGGVAASAYPLLAPMHKVRKRGQRVEKRHASIVRCRLGGWCGDGFSGGRRAATIAVFLGRPGPKAKSRFKFCPEAIIRASVLTFSSPLSLNLLDPCHSLASPNSGSTHTARLRKALR
jgi:hypothetical protein